MEVYVIEGRRRVVLIASDTVEKDNWLRCNNMVRQRNGICYISYHVTRVCQGICCVERVCRGICCVERVCRGTWPHRGPGLSCSSRAATGGNQTPLWLWLWMWMWVWLWEWVWGDIPVLLLLVVALLLRWYEEHHCLSPRRHIDVVGWCCAVPQTAVWRARRARRRCIQFPRFFLR